MRLRLLILVSAPAFAQWFNHPTPGIPRTPDGKPNLSAPAPKTADSKPDLSGLWKAPNGKYLLDLAADLKPDGAPMLPWAAAIYKQRVETLGKERPSGWCIPHGIPDSMAVAGYPFKILQLPGVVVMLFEEMNHYRQIFTDGRALPKDPQPTWLGYSVGRWEGDTFVVESSGFHEETWLDDPGHPHTDALKITERFRRPDFGRLEVEIIIDDPKTYTKPWGAKESFNYFPDTEIIENVCENEKDLTHLVGK